MFELAIVEQAKGVLMLRYGIGSYEALAVLGRWSQERGASLHELARALTHGVCQGHCGPGAEQTALVRWLEAQLRKDVTAHLPSDAGMEVSHG